MLLENNLNIKYIVKDIKYKIIKTKQIDDGVILYLDNKEKIYLSVETFFEYSINNIKGIDDKLYEEFKNKERIYLSYKSVLRKLSSKDFTIKQIKDFLKTKKQLTNEEIDTIINKLLSYDLLNDDNYCRNRYNYLDKQCLSIKQIKVKLLKEGISQDIIDKYVNGNEDNELNKAIILARKYSKSIKNKSINSTKQTILSKLVNYGYSYENAKNAIDSLNLVNDNELELLKKEYNKAIRKYEKKFTDYDLKNHVYAYLINKGFKSEDIKNVMEV